MESFFRRFDDHYLLCLREWRDYVCWHAIHLVDADYGKRLSAVDTIRVLPLVGIIHFKSLRAMRTSRVHFFSFSVSVFY